MTIDEQTRFDLRSYFREAMGEDRLADALMDSLPALDYSQLVTKEDLRLTSSELQSEVTKLRTGLRGEMSELRTGLRGEMTELRTELRGEMTKLRAELGGEMTELRAEFKADIADLERSNVNQMRTLITFGVGSTLSTWGVMATLFTALG
ncbi:MAG: hypothetical protein V3V01_16025 [Acidimicrobiales bacterium]